ncbi:MAG: MiaB/RimO family radical SAM methylthiotransferase, partial [Abditibacteriales bacterium]|nr:MiaB/RimO family radical SAM methylthiotransferase [Abditibacteriales bacterium]MDW8368337.1 MiaB/RimO family radical SAM methylthiotransferase [Abditibacteriales bacterium]
RAVRNNPHAVIAVTGCAAEWAADQFRRMVKEAIVVGNGRKRELPALIAEVVRSKGDFPLLPGMQRPSDTPYVLPIASRERAVLKVQDGCNRHCAFCIIPRTRGKPYSRPMEEVLQEARALVAHGAKEIVLTGVILGWYGSDLPGRRKRLTALLKEMEAIDGLERIRLSSLDPRDLTEDLVEVMAGSRKICPHLHLCAQSGSDAVLRAMRRGYTAAEFAEWVRRFRAAIPHLSLTTDMLVGFPGETEEQFQETMAFARQMRFSAMHIFPFSARPGTPAATLPCQVPPATIERRAKQLGALARELSALYARRYIGKTASVLVERCDEATGVCEGLTNTYVRVVATGGAPAQGEIVNVTIQDWQVDHLTGEVTGERSSAGERSDRLFPRG